MKAKISLNAIKYTTNELNMKRQSLILVLSVYIFYFSYHCSSVSEFLFRTLTFNTLFIILFFLKFAFLAHVASVLMARKRRKRKALCFSFFLNEEEEDFSAFKIVPFNDFAHVIHPLTLKSFEKQKARL